WLIGIYMQAQPGETRAVFLRARASAVRSRSVSGLETKWLVFGHLVSRSLHADFCAGERVYEQHRPTSISLSNAQTFFGHFP
ncbi:hypothetical protein PZ04_12170, partial [Lacticaseibacillus rhamnosus]